MEHPGEPARPAMSRRQQVGAASARSLLMTLLGEYVLPHGGAAWTSTLLRAFEGLGVEEKSARQALARTAADGWIASERAGRRVRWVLTAPGRRLLTEGAERIYSFGAPSPPWDGRWLVVMATVPETQRKLRHQLRTKLTWAGFGSPAPGMWISPHPARAPEAEEIMRELGLDASAFSFCGAFGDIGSQRGMVDQAWDLAETAAQYEAFLDEFAGLRPRPGAEVVLAQVRLVHEWRRFPFLDPRLPAELLPARWIGDRAAKVFAKLHGDWQAQAQASWGALADDAAA
ncbi:PaaX family transcriptional regulator [Yinghuangia seranimata]|uniref:PaaX family transcriptional regulator n=1 Tax=Yinghuangia seranimata TaxID=408067 RepID=UPI00248CB76B|nr:PaaX family transcriptional regulator C-terminal domain-containing protein [Yinghuangia seranimata]MDI2130053.1 PaaX family transcriptional regulator C-terminal domain-containing protein [Yinghuangia seranimata]